MARIPIYQRRELASSVVGTPGVDLSQAQIGQHVSNLFEGVSKDTFAVAAERQAAINQTEALKVASDFEIESYKILNDHTSQHSAEPSGKTELLKQRLQERLTATLDTIKSPAVKASVQRAGTEVIGRTAIKEVQWEYNQGAALALDNVNTTVNNRAQELYLAGMDGDFGKFTETMEGLPAIFETSGKILSVEEQSKFRSAAPKSLANGFIQGMIETNPATAYEVLKSGTFDNYVTSDGTVSELLTPEEKEKYKDTAKSRIANLKDRAEFEQLTSVLAGQDDLLQKSISGKLTLSDVEALPEGPTKKAFKDLYDNANPMTDVQKYEVSGALWAEYEALKIDKKKGVSKKGSFEEIIDFRNRVVKARANGSISDEEARNFFESTATPLAKQAEKVKGMRDGYSVIKKWLDSAGLKEDAAARGRLMEKFGNMFLKDQRAGTPGLVKETAQLAIRQFATEEYPSLGLLPGTPNSIMKGDGTQIKLLPGQSRLKPDVKAGRKDYVVKQDPVTGVSARVFSDGTFEVIK